MCRMYTHLSYKPWFLKEILRKQRDPNVKMYLILAKTTASAMPLFSIFVGQMTTINRYFFL